MSTRCPPPMGRGGAIKRIEPSRGPPIPKLGYGYTYFQYSSKPTNQTRPKYRNNVERPRGVHDFYNVMWDPHVYRGPTYVPFQEVERHRAKVLGEAKKWRKRDRWTHRMTHIEIPKTPPRPPVTNFVLNLDKFLIEDTPPPSTSDYAEQTDYINRKKIRKPPVVAKTGFDASTQMLPGEMFTFDQEIQPLVATVGVKVLEQALLENIEEEELEAIRTEQNEYHERRRQEALRLKHLEQRCQARAVKQAEAMKRLDLKRQEAEATENRVGARMFSQSYLKLLTPQLVDELRHDGFFELVDVQRLTHDFTPWLNQGVEKELCTQLLAAGVLDLMLENLGLNREFEYIAGQIQSANTEIPGQEGE